MLSLAMSTAESYAENIEVHPWRLIRGTYAVEFDFRCPNCGQLHHMREITQQAFSQVFYALRCGSVTVRMPE